MASLLASSNRTTVWFQALGLAGWILLCFSAAIPGGWFLPGDWYAGLQKPSWNPPPWIFGPVWSALYVMMAVAAWSVWRRGGFGRNRGPLLLFLLQLLLNALWSPLFFGLRLPGLALVDLVLLWVVLFVTLIRFWKVNTFAGALLVPYLAWVTFAGMLNLTLWLLNR